MSDKERLRGLWNNPEGRVLSDDRDCYEDKINGRVNMNNQNNNFQRVVNNTTNKVKGDLNGNGRLDKWEKDLVLKTSKSKMNKNLKFGLKKVKRFI